MSIVGNVACSSDSQLFVVGVLLAGHWLGSKEAHIAAAHVEKVHACCSLVAVLRTYKNGPAVSKGLYECMHGAVI